MSLPESTRFSPFSSFAFLAVPGAYPYLTAKSIVAVAVHTATLVGEPMKPPEFKCSDNQSALIMREEEKRLRETRETLFCAAATSLLVLATHFLLLRQALFIVVAVYKDMKDTGRGIRLKGAPLSLPMLSFFPRHRVARPALLLFPM